MPRYDACCALCGTVEEVTRSISERHNLGTCECGGERYRIWTATPSSRASSGDIEGYQSPIDGAWIGSRSQHRDHMKRHGVIELGNEKPKLGKFQTTIPRESIRREIKDNVERMKSHGTWRER